MFLVMPYITYGIDVWYGAYKSTTEQVFLLQERAVRYINSLPYGEHTTPYFGQLKLLKRQTYTNILY